MRNFVVTLNKIYATQVEIKAEDKEKARSMAAKITSGLEWKPMDVKVKNIRLVYREAEMKKKLGER